MGAPPSRHVILESVTLCMSREYMAQLCRPSPHGVTARVGGGGRIEAAREATRGNGRQPQEATRLAIMLLHFVEWVITDDECDMVPLKVSVSVGVMC